MEEFQNLTRAFVDINVKPQYKLDTDRIFDLVIDAYVTRPNIVDPRQLRAAYIQVGVTRLIPFCLPACLLACLPVHLPDILHATTICTCPSVLVSQTLPTSFACHRIVNRAK